jgi:hypothetical protein
MGALEVDPQINPTIFSREGLSLRYPPYGCVGELAKIFFEYGEERLSRQIVERPPLKTTTELAEAIASCVPPKYRYSRIRSKGITENSVY